MSFLKADLLGRLPYRMIESEEGGLLFRWLYVGNELFCDPFFEETMLRCLSLPENANGLPVTTVAELLGAAEAVREADTIAPSAFIFHVSRCGSTLLSQMLSLDPRHIVLSEVPLLDAILRLPARDRQGRAHPADELYRAALRLLGRRRRGIERALFVKVDSWHTFFFDRIRSCYPGVPAILLYRRPSEVFRSHQKRRGMQAVPGVIEPELFGLDRAQVQGMTLDDYLDRVLYRFFEEYLRILETDGAAWPVSYHDGAVNMVQELARRTGISITEETLAAMKERAKFHAKYPDRPFAEARGEFRETQADRLFRQLNLKTRVAPSF